MKAILHQIQRIFIRHFFTKELVNQGIQGSNKEEMVFTLFSNLLERVFQGTLQKLDHHGRRKMEHFATGGNLAVVTVIGEFSIYKRFAMINTANIFKDRVLHILGKERLEP